MARPELIVSLQQRAPFYDDVACCLLATQNAAAERKYFALAGKSVAITTASQKEVGPGPGGSTKVPAFRDPFALEPYV